MNMLKLFRIQTTLPAVARTFSPASQVSKSANSCVQMPYTCNTARMYSGLTVPLQTRLCTNKNISNTANMLTVATPIQMNFTRGYKARVSLELRCDNCFFVKRKGRWYVECKTKPRHKQMQIVSKHKLYRDDYSKGRIGEACYWGYQHARWYRIGDNKYSRMHWLGDRLGPEI